MQLLDDPKSAGLNLHSAVGVQKSQFPIKFLVAESLRGDRRIAALTAAQKSWNDAIGTMSDSPGGQLFAPIAYYSEDYGTYKGLDTPLKDAVSAFIFDGSWLDFTSKPKNVLGTAVWSYDSPGGTIVRLDVRLNVELFSLGFGNDASSGDVGKLVDLQTLATHELGHALGLAHDSRKSKSFAGKEQTSIMTPALPVGLLGNDEVTNLRKVSDLDQCKMWYLYNPSRWTSQDCQGLAAAANQVTSDP